MPFRQVMRDNLVVERIQDVDPFMQLSLVPQIGHVGYHEFQWFIRVPVPIDLIGIAHMRRAGVDAGSASGLGANACLFATLVSQIIAEQPAGLTAHNMGQAVIAVRWELCVLFQ